MREEWRLLEWEMLLEQWGQLRGELNAFAGLQPIFVASRQKILTGMVALGDWLGCYRVDSRVYGVRKLVGLDPEAHGNCC